jgi:hypothetical protein
MKRGDLAIISIILFIAWLLTRPMERDAKNWDKLKDLSPEHRRHFINFLNDIRGLGYEPRITSGVRTFERQQQLHRQDKRNPPGGHTSHETGIAIDMVLFTNTGKRIDKNTTKRVWETTGVPELAISKYKMRWGGNFKNYYDPIHFDYLKL